MCEGWEEMCWFWESERGRWGGRYGDERKEEKEKEDGGRG